MSTFEARFVSPALCTGPGIISRRAQFGRQRGRNLRFALCHRRHGHLYTFSRKRLFTEFFGGETNRERLPRRGNFFLPLRFRFPRCFSTSVVAKWLSDASCFQGSPATKPCILRPFCTSLFPLPCQRVYLTISPTLFTEALSPARHLFSSVPSDLTRRLPWHLWSRNASPEAARPSWRPSKIWMGTRGCFWCLPACRTDRWPSSPVPESLLPIQCHFDI